MIGLSSTSVRVSTGVSSTGEGVLSTSTCGESRKIDTGHNTRIFASNFIIQISHVLHNMVMFKFSHSKKFLEECYAESFLHVT